MARIIAISGGKGGIGKTTTVANLGLALRDMGKDVTLIDTNLTTPSLSLHLGIPLYPITLHDVLRGDAYITEAIYIHPSGMRVIPASLSLEDLEGTDAKRLSHALKDMLGQTDVVLLDCSAGLGNETVAAMRAAHDLLLVTNPDLPSVTDALKTKKLAQEMGINILGVVVNRVSSKRVQMNETEIREMLELPIIAKIPDDVGVDDAIYHKNPVVVHKPHSPAAREFKRLAANLVGEEYHNGSSSLLGKFRAWLMGFT